MIAAFGSGSMFALVSGMGGPNQIPNMISSGVFFALAQGGIYKVCNAFSVNYFAIADIVFFLVNCMALSVLVMNQAMMTFGNFSFWALFSLYDFTKLKSFYWFSTGLNCMLINFVDQT